MPLLCAAPKGKTTPVYMNSLYNRIFSAPSMALLFQRLDNDTKTADADEVIEASLAQIAGEELTQQEKMLQQAWFGQYATLHKTIRKDS